jgi:hypothetical protein
MTTRSYRKNARQRQCHTHRGYLASNCPLCAMVLKAFLDKELPHAPSPREGGHSGPRTVVARSGIFDGSGA